MRAPADKNPYIGLRPFDREDSLYFFGRREQTAELLERLYATHFLAVLGSSGCGKSSLIRAGLIPALLGGFLVEERDRWRIAVMRPGSDPMRNLARALCADGNPGVDGNPGEATRDGPEDLLRGIFEDHTQAVIDYLEPRLGSDANQLILIDQFEEIFTFRGTEPVDRIVLLSPEQGREQARRRVEAAEFVDLIIDLSRRSELPIYTTLTMRTDFLGDCDLFYRLPEAINRGRYLLPRLTRRQLKQAIEGPALLEQAQLAPRLVDRLLNKLGDRTDRLPLLQHALRRTWELWQQDGGQGAIDLEHYKAAGTLSDALSIHANEALEGVDREAAARIFKCLTDTDSSYRRVRRPAALSELVAVCGKAEDDVRAILDRFAAEGRHFVHYDPTADDPLVDVSHESLIRQWEVLRTWVDEERESRDRYVELVTNARREEAGKVALLIDPELGSFLRWRENARPDARWAARYQRKEDDFEAAMRFLDRSRDAALARKRRRKRNRDLAVAAAVAFVMLLSVALGWAIYSWNQAEKARARAQDQARVALAFEWLQKDPTRAALVLLELEQPDETPYATQRMVEALERQLADLVLWHSAEVRAAALSADGTRAATAAADGTVRIWDPATGELLRMLDGHGGEVWSASFSPDGDRVATASFDRTARIWDAASGELLRTLEGHGDEVLSASFSPDGGRVVTASLDRTAKVWRVGSGELEQTLQGHERPVFSASFHPGGERVVTASSDRTARIWDAGSGALVRAFAGHEGEVLSASFSPDGSRVLTASVDRTARIWDASSGEATVIEGHEAALKSASFSPDGARVVTTSEDATARIWDASSGAELAILEGHAAGVLSASFSPGGDRVLTASQDRTARLWDSGSGSQIAVLSGHGDLVTSARFGPGGAWVATASFDQTARIWRPGRGERTWGTPSAQVARLAGHQAGVLEASFSPDGTRVLTASADGTARIWDPSSGTEVGRFDGHTAAFAPGGARVVTGGRTARVFDLSANVLATLGGGDERLLAVAFSSDGTRLLTLSRDTARVWDAASGAEVTRIDGPSDSVAGAALSPDGRRVVTASYDLTARLWDVASGAETGTLEGHSAAVSAASFSPDGKRVVTASDDATARIWDVASGAELATLVGHSGGVNDASFSPDGRRVVTASEDRTARIWDAASGEEVATLEGHADAVYGASFSPDGRRVVTASEDRTARIWLARGAPLQALIRERTRVCLDTDFRDKNLGETRDAAEKKQRACEGCLETYRPRRSSAALVDLAALSAYRDCLRRALR